MVIDAITRDDLVDYLEGQIVERVDLGAVCIHALADGRLLVEPVTGDPVILSGM